MLVTLILDFCGKATCPPSQQSTLGCTNYFICLAVVCVCVSLCVCVCVCTCVCVYVCVCVCVCMCVCDLACICWCTVHRLACYCCCTVLAFSFSVFFSVQRTELSYTRSLHLISISLLLLQRNLFDQFQCYTVQCVWL